MKSRKNSHTGRWLLFCLLRLVYRPTFVTAPTWCWQENSGCMSRTFPWQTLRVGRSWIEGRDVVDSFSSGVWTVFTLETPLPHPGSCESNGSCGFEMQASQYCTLRHCVFWLPPAALMIYSPLPIPHAQIPKINLKNPLFYPHA